MPGMSEEGHRDQVSVLTGSRDCLPRVFVFANLDVLVRRTRFATFPQVLVVHAKKFQLVNWVPAKLGASASRGNRLEGLTRAVRSRYPRHSA